MKSRIYRSAPLFAGIGFATLLSGVAAVAQDTVVDTTPNTKSVTARAEPDDAARQTVAKCLRRLGVNLDWRKASLKELRKTYTDLVAAGDDEDMRLRIVLAARLRESGVVVNWRTLSADELTERYSEALQETPARSERSPASAREDSSGVTVTTSVESSVELPPLPRVRQPRPLSDAEIEAIAVMNQPPPPVYLQPAPVQTFGESIIFTNAVPVYPGQTIVTGNGLTIVTNGRPNTCTDAGNYSHQTVGVRPQPLYSPGTPRSNVQRPVTMPGAKPGAIGAIPIEHPRIPWLNGN